MLRTFRVNRGSGHPKKFHGELNGHIRSCSLREESRLIIKNLLLLYRMTMSERYNEFRSNYK